MWAQRCRVPAPISCGPAICRWFSTNRHFATVPAAPFAPAADDVEADSTGRYGNRRFHRRFAVAVADADGMNAGGRNRPTPDAAAEELNYFCYKFIQLSNAIY